MKKYDFIEDRFISMNKSRQKPLLSFFFKEEKKRRERTKVTFSSKLAYPTPGSLHFFQRDRHWSVCTFLPCAHA